MSTEDLRPVELLASHHHVEGFSSGTDSLDRWLHHSARVAAAAGAAAVYIVTQHNHVVGYYALAMSAVAHKQAPSRLRRGMPDPVPVVLLARLAIDQDHQGRHFGGHLLVDALHRCVRGGQEFGARAVVVDAIDDTAAEFYRHFDFHDLDYRRLWRRLADIAAALDR